MASRVRVRGTVDVVENVDEIVIGDAGGGHDAVAPDARSKHGAKTYRKIVSSAVDWA